MNFLFTADIHANKSRAQSVLKLFSDIKTIINEKQIDYFLIGGDLWDSMITNTKASGFVDIQKELNDICKMCKVVAISGTPSHEPFGSIDFISSLGGTVVTKPTLLDLQSGFDTIKLLAIPEPRRSEFVTGSTEETTKLIMQSLDKACSNKADIIIYHGEIGGAVLDNGVKASSDVQLSKKMILNTGAKLTLAGHIHSPQEVFDNCHYVGSPIPVTFGESHKPSIITFSFENGEVTSLKRIYTGFPQNKTIDCDEELYNKLFNLKFTNTNVKLRLSLDPEKRKLFNKLEACKQFQEATSANSVTISVSSKRDVAVRSKTIREKKSLTDKFLVYADVNNITATKSLIEKSKELEDNLLIKYQFPTHSFDLQFVSIKGAIGFKDRELFEVDFSKYENGVLAIEGKIGTGKSTFLENCHPYPQMLTRSGALAKHFYSKDSHRILIYKDENGKLYKLSMLITVNNKSSVCKYYAETSDDNGTTWQSVPECDGNLDSYNAFVNSTFGSIEMFLRTSFFAKEQTKGIPDIASATKGQRIELFSQLLGTDNIAIMHELVKERAKLVEQEMKQYENVEEQKETLSIELSKKRTVYKDRTKELTSCNNKEKELVQKIQDCMYKRDEYNKNIAKYGSSIKMRNDLIGRNEELRGLLARLQDHKLKNDFAINHQNDIKEYTDAKNDLTVITDELNKVSAKLNAVNDKYTTSMDELYSLNEQLSAAESKLESVDMKIEAAKKEADFEILEICPTCGAKLTEKKKSELLAKKENVNTEVASLEDFKKTQSKILSECKSKVVSCKSKISKLKTEKEDVTSDYNKINERYGTTKAFIDMNSRYNEFIGYMIVDNLETDINKHSIEIENNNKMLETLKGFEEHDYDSEINAMNFDLDVTRDDKIRLTSAVAVLESEIKNLEEQFDKISHSVSIMKGLAKEYEEYNILLNAYSNSGIMALELEAAAPDIANITNCILQESYGDKFSVSFTTLHQGRNKLIDDFSIDVFNNDTGRTAPIEYLSSGEKIWVMQALYYAFSIIRMEKTGFSFKVRFCDECDGSLDSEARLKYVKMINSTHLAGNARLTVLITHSQEVKDIVQQTISL